MDLRKNGIGNLGTHALLNTLAGCLGVGLDAGRSLCLLHRLDLRDNDATNYANYSLLQLLDILKNCWGLQLLHDELTINAADYLR